MRHEETYNDRPAVDWALLVGRLAVGTIFVAHGAQKLFGVFGGPGIEAVARQMGDIGYYVAAAEFLGGLGLILGILPRFSALALIGVMIGAIVQVHWKNGFFASSGGFEFNLALIGLLAVILIAGPGRIAISHLFSYRPSSSPTGRVATSR